MSKVEPYVRKVPDRKRIDVDNTKLGFGKYQDKTPDELSELDPAYMVWIFQELSVKPCTHAMYILCKNADSENHNFEYDNMNYPQ